jgi:hypothetical protein
MPEWGSPDDAMSLPTPDSLILVAVMPDRRDLEIARLLGWYRIRFKSAPKVLEADFVAFYQTGAFGPDHRWRIESFSELRGHELVTRRELFRDEPDHPRANEEYYKLALGPLQSLPEPILAKSWKRLTFLYTTGALFSMARELPDLVAGSEERAGLWRILRERALQGGHYKADDLGDLDLDPALLALMGGLWSGGGPATLKPPET